MALNHLSQDEILEFLDSNSEVSNQKINLHLNKCNVCKRNITEYQVVYDQVKLIEKFDPSPDFSNTIMKNLSMVVPKNSSNLRTTFISYILFSLLSLSIIFLIDSYDFIFYNQVIDSISSLFSSILYFVSSFQFIANNINILISLLLLLLGFGILNHRFLDKKFI
jgi:hypothetical protein